MAREKVLHDKNEIIEVAFNIVEDEGLEHLSIRHVAKQLGISSMTIYNYIENFKIIKKEIIIKGFDLLYDQIYSALKELDFPVNARSFCMVIALETFRFAQIHREVFLLMFSNEQKVYRNDAEIRPFYAFLQNFFKRSKVFRKEWQKNEIGYRIFESFIFALSRECASGIRTITEEEYRGYVDYYLDRVVDK